MKDQQFVFHFFGKGSQKNFLKNKFSSLPNVKFYSHIEYIKLHSILSKMDCLVVSFGFQDRFPLFGYELNKLNNYIMAKKPILVLGKKENLLNNRGKFIFVTNKDFKQFEKKLFLIRNKYQFFLKIAKLNKQKLLLRNDPKLIFNQTLKHLNGI